MHLILLLISFIFPSYLGAIERPFESLTYLSEQYTPLNYLDKSGLQKGYAIELLHQVWYELDVPAQPIQILPWARAYSTAQQQQNAVLFSTARIDSRENIFKWVCSIINLRIVLLGLKSDKIIINSLAEAREYQIAALNQDVGEQILIEAGFEPNKVQQVSFLDNALKMLIQGRVDLLSSSEINAFRKLQEMGIDPNLFEVVWVLNTYPICFAFNLNVEEEVVTKFQQALLKVQENKAYIKMLKRKYGLSLNENTLN